MLSFYFLLSDTIRYTIGKKQYFKNDHNIEVLFSEINMNDRQESSSENAVKLNIPWTEDFHATNFLIQFLLFGKLICSNYCKYICKIF